MSDGARKWNAFVAKTTRDQAADKDSNPARDPELRRRGLDRRAEQAISAENARAYGRSMAEGVIKSRHEGDPQAAARDEYLKRH